MKQGKQSPVTCHKKLRMTFYLLLCFPVSFGGVLVSCADNSEERRAHHIDDTLAKASVALDQGDLKRSCVALSAAIHAQGEQIGVDVRSAFELQLAYALGDKSKSLAALGRLEHLAKNRVRRLRQYLKDTRNLEDTPKERLPKLMRLSANTSLLLLVTYSHGFPVYTTPSKQRQYSELLSLMSKHADIFIEE